MGKLVLIKVYYVKPGNKKQTPGDFEFAVEL